VSKVTTLAEGQLTAADCLGIKLIEADETRNPRPHLVGGTEPLDPGYVCRVVGAVTGCWVLRWFSVIGIRR
jgi:hypothetical protein